MKTKKKLKEYQDLKGLKHWVKDYKQARKFGNVKLAKQIYANIEKRRKKTGWSQKEVYF